MILYSCGYLLKCNHVYNNHQCSIFKWTVSFKTEYRYLLFSCPTLPDNKTNEKEKWKSALMMRKNRYRKKHMHIYMPLIIVKITQGWKWMPKSMPAGTDFMQRYWKTSFSREVGYSKWQGQRSFPWKKQICLKDENSYRNYLHILFILGSCKGRWENPPSLQPNGKVEENLWVGSSFQLKKNMCQGKRCTMYDMKIK